MTNKKFKHSSLLSQIKQLVGPLKGFTMVELLVVITILSVMTTIGFTIYSRAQIAARDARRKDDLRQIQTALALYRQIYGRYPCTQGDVNSLPITPGTSDPGQQNSNPAYNLAYYPGQPFWLKDSGCKGATPPDVSAQHPWDRNIISDMPIDPLLNNNYLNPAPGGQPHMFVGDAVSHGYTYFSPNPNYDLKWNDHRVPVGQTYVLWTKLENVSDPESCQNKQYTTCSGEDACHGYDPKMYIIVGGC